MLGEPLSAKDRIIRARSQLQKDSPFFAYLSMWLTFKETKKVERCGVNARGEVFYNEDFIQPLPDNELKGLILHELLHCALSHPIRLSRRDPDCWNLAADIIVNNLIINNGFTPPSDNIIPRYNQVSLGKFVTVKDIDKKTAEEIYDEIYPKLPKAPNNIFLIGCDMQQQTQGDGKKQPQPGKGQGDKGVPFSLISEEEARQLEEKWRKLLVSAATISKMWGKEPLGAERLLDGLFDSKMNWRSLLYRYITNEIPNDYTYCLDKDTKIRTKQGSKLLKDVREGDIILGIKDNNKLVETIIKECFKSNVKKKYVITTAKGNKITSSENHHFLTDDGKWVKAEDLKVGQEIRWIRKGAILHEDMKKAWDTNRAKRKRIADRCCHCGRLKSLKHVCPTKEEQQRIAITNLQNPVSKSKSIETIRNMIKNGLITYDYLKGKRKPETIKKMSAAGKLGFKLGRRKVHPNLRNTGRTHFKKGQLVGEKSHRWKGGITPLKKHIRELEEYKTWRRSIFTRDNFTCVWCKNRGGKLEADHIKRFADIIRLNNIKTTEDAQKCSELWDTKNGRTLCRDCHDTTRGRKIRYWGINEKLGDKNEEKC